MATTLITSQEVDVRRREARLPGNIPNVAFLDLSKGFFEFDDFLSEKVRVRGYGNDPTSYLGTMAWAQYRRDGSITATTGQATAPGILQLEATQNNGKATLFKNPAGVIAGSIQLDCIIRAQVPVLNDATNKINLYLGFGDTYDSDENVDGIYFHYHQANTTWQAETTRASTRTTADTGVTVQAGQWYTMKFTVAADGSQVQFYLGTTAENMTLVATITTNIPTDVTYAVGPQLKVYKDAGNGARQLLVDYYVFSGTIVGGR